MNSVATGYPYELGAEDPFRTPPPVIPPCPLCSGQVDRDDPVAQALDWGVRVAESEAGASGFWRVMTAADVYRSAELDYAREHVGDGAALNGFVAQALQVATHPPVDLEDGDIRFGDEEEGDDDVEDEPPAPEGEGERGDADEDSWETWVDGFLEKLQPLHLRTDEAITKEEDVRRILDLVDFSSAVRDLFVERTNKPPNIIEEPSGSESGGPMCCPEAFNYPEHWLRIGMTSRGRKRRVGIHFAVEAEYKPRPIPCFCTCCQFRQYVITSYRKRPGQDCAVKDESNQWTPTVGAQEESRINPLYPVLCAGDRPTNKPRVNKAIWEVAGTKYPTDCDMEFVDTPGAIYRPVSTDRQPVIGYQTLFIGVIWDICLKVLADIGVFKIDWASASGAYKPGAEWSGDLTKKPLKILRKPMFQTKEAEERATNHMFVPPNEPGN